MTQSAQTAEQNLLTVLAGQESALSLRVTRHHASTAQLEVTLPHNIRHQPRERLQVHWLNPPAVALNVLYTGCIKTRAEGLGRVRKVTNPSTGYSIVKSFSP